MNQTQQRVVKVLERMIEQTKDSAVDAQVYAEVLEGELSNLSADDFFGTEGQNDPRGDMRDDEWSMNRVQGVDK